MDYSKTVNLPTTDFPMRANLPKREPEILQKWKNDDIYNKIMQARKDSELYILHDGPPYANGHIHIGHALNKILKDMIIKHKTMMGFKVPYVPGWDCHGLPIELNVTKKLGKKAREMEKVEIRKGCRDYAEEFVALQMEEFKRLGVFADYEHPYKTLTLDYEHTILDTFGKILEGGYIYRSKKPIYWCPSCVTALAEAEVEYDDHTSPSIFVKFKVDPATIGFDSKNKDNTHVVIWTTTPWTLPANLAVCFHPEFEYNAYNFGEETFILAKGLVEDFTKVTGLAPDGELNITKQHIEDLKVAHPFLEQESKVIFGDHVTLEAGTGIVHTAPGHGNEDYIVGLKYALEVFNPVDNYGKFTSDFALMQGMKVFDANDKIIELLKENNRMIHVAKMEHSYPHCWRCKKPLIFRATEQWFFDMDHKDMRKKGMETVDKTDWIPAWGEARFKSMVETRPDWCLSRQRTWGVPIPSFRCEECDENMMTHETVAHFAEIAKTEGIDTWYSKELNELIPSDTKCKCGSTTFRKEFDILDVWFDSGCSHFSVLNREDHRWPADLYLEGSDQHRGWFQSSLWPALAIKDRAPYNKVLTHGFVLDDKGKAMSKSMGNVIPPEKLIQQYGADVLRMWVSSEDYRNDLKIGMDVVKQTSDSYRRIRNTVKFIIGIIADFDTKDAVAYDQLPDIDKWILHKLHELSDKVIAHYENFEFHMVYRRILNFCAVELSSIYFDISKDILYIELKDAKIRRANLTVLSEIHNTITRLIAPILAYTAEEIWQFTGNEDSIHMQQYYMLDDKYNNSTVFDKIEKLVNIKKDVLKSLEEMRKEKLIKVSLEADVSIYVADADTKQLMQDMGDDFKRFLQVANITLLDTKTDKESDFDNSSISSVRTEGEKCPRCWNYYPQMSGSGEHAELCDRCAAIVTEMQKQGLV